METDNAQDTNRESERRHTLEVPMLHCTKNDAVFYDTGLVAMGPFLVALSLKQIPQSRVRLEQTTDCKVCVFEGTCTGHVRHTVPEALLLALA